MPSAIVPLGTGIDVTPAGTSVTMTVTAVAEVGTDILVACALDDPSTSAISCADSQGNSYVLEGNLSGASAPDLRGILFRATVAGALAPGDTITVTHPTANVRAIAAMTASEFVHVISPFDRTSSGTGVSNHADSSITAATNKATELAVGLLAARDPATTIDPDPDWNVIESVTADDGSGNTVFVQLLAQELTAIGNYNVAGFLDNAARHAAVIVTYRLVAHVALSGSLTGTGVVTTDESLTAVLEGAAAGLADSLLGLTVPHTYTLAGTAAGEAGAVGALQVVSQLDLLRRVERLEGEALRTGERLHLSA